MFVAFPIWWLIGVSSFTWPIVAVAMLVALIWRRRTRAPVSFVFWIAFTSWVLMSGLQLQSVTKITTFGYRLALYVAAGVLFLYVYNLPRVSWLDAKVLRILTYFWMIVVVGGYAGIVVGAHTFVPPFEHLLPHGLRSQPFVQELVQPVFASVEGFLGHPVPRPTAPFTYTNTWGGNMGVLTMVALAAVAAAGPGRRRRLLIAVLAASLVPMAFSLNRGMFLSIGAGILYVTVRLVGRRRVGALLALLVVTAILVFIVALTPLGHLVSGSFSSSHGHSNEVRLSLYQQAIAGANQSPLFGQGEPQEVTAGQAMTGTPAIGTQGQLWMLLYSNGYPATMLFVSFFLAVLWQTRRARGTAGLWLHAVPLVALAQIAVYGWLPSELQVVMVAAALAYRRCWRPVGRAGREVITRPLEPTVPGVSARLRNARMSAWEIPASRPSRVAIRPIAVPAQPRDGVRDPAAWRNSLGRPSSRLVPVPPPRLAAVAPPASKISGQEPHKPNASVVVARGSLINLVAMMAGAVMSFGLVVLASRWLQPHGAGVFFELIALFTIMASICKLGADTGLTRWISRARAIGGLSDVRRVLVIAVIPVALIGAAVSVGLWLAAPEISGLFLRGVPVAAGAVDIRFIAPLIVLGALSTVIVDGARGFGRMWPNLAIEGLGKPGVRIVAVAAVLMAGLSLHVAIIAWGLPVIAGLIAASVIFTSILRKEAPGHASAGTRPPAEAGSRLRHGVTNISTEPMSASRAPAYGPTPREHPRFPATPDLDATVELPVVFDPVAPSAEMMDKTGRAGDNQSSQRKTEGLFGSGVRQLAAEFWAFTGPRAFQATFQVSVLFLDVLLVGALASTSQAGIYSAVSKLAILGTFALEANRLAIGPQLSAMLSRREHGPAADLYQTATRSLILLTFPLYIVMAIFPAVVLSIFGSQYTAGAAALAVLCLAMLINLGTGNVTVVLLMGGKSSWSAINAGVALIANIGLNLWLIPRIGILGAAVAWSVSIAIDNILAMIEVRWVMGLAPFGPGYWPIAGIALACFGATGIEARLILGQTIPALIIALLAGMVSYGFMLYVARASLRLGELTAIIRPNYADSRWRSPQKP